MADFKVHLAAQRAVEKGLLRAEDLERLLEQAQGARPLADVLAAEAALDPTVLRDLLADVRLQDFGALLETDSGGPLEVDEARRDPSRRFGKYVLCAEIGEGGMGIVYRAWQEDLGRWVALKVLRLEASRDAGARFLQEAQLAAKVNHAHLVPIYDVGQRDGIPYLAMALMEGGSLEGRVLPVREAVETMAAVATAVEEIHRQGIVHRDIKPGNLLRDRQGRVHLGDFSLARALASDARLTASGVMLGTVAFASPEQVAGRGREIGPRSDVYSLGATLYTLLTGRPPFPGHDALSTAQKVLHEEPVPLRRIRGDLHRDVETLCLRAMARSPRDRYPSAKEFAADLQRFLKGEEIAARPLSPIAKALRALKRRRAGAVAAITLAVLVAGWLFWLQHGTPGGDAKVQKAVEDGRRALEEARRLLTADMLDAREARRRLESVVAETTHLLASGGPSVQALAAEARFLLGDLGEAERLYSEALARDPADPRLYQARGRVRLEQAQWMVQEALGASVDAGSFQRKLAEAESDFAAAVERGGKAYAIGRLIEAYRMVHDGRFADAARLCEEEIVRGSPEMQYELVLGVARCMSGDGRGGMDAFTEAIRRAPAQAIAYFERAVVAEMRGDLARAVEDYGRVIELRPACMKPYNNRAALLDRLGRFDEAVADYDAALRLDPGNLRMQSCRIMALWDRGRKEEALRESDALARARPDRALACWTRGELRRIADDLEGAEEDFERAIQAERSSLWGYAGLGWVRLARKDFTGAVDEFTRALDRLTPEDGLIAGDLHAARGRAHVGLKRWDLALRDFDAGVRLDPSNGEYRLYRGSMRFTLGQREGARLDLLEAIRLDPSLEVKARPMLDQLGSK